MKVHHKILDDGTVETTRRFVVHKFSVGDVDDPMVYAAEPLYKWENSEEGKWIKKHATDVEWKNVPNISVYGTDYVILATLKDSDYTYFLMKFK